MTAEEYAQTAETMGRKAFEHGRDGIPTQDPALMALIEQNRDNVTVSPLAAWSSGWVQAALAAPEEDPDPEYDATDEGPSWRECWHGHEKGLCPTCNRGEK